MPYVLILHEYLWRFAIFVYDPTLNEFSILLDVDRFRNPDSHIPGQPIDSTSLHVTLSHSHLGLGSPSTVGATADEPSCFSACGE